jgi:hypothetical protein
MNTSTKFLSGTLALTTVAIMIANTSSVAAFRGGQGKQSFQNSSTQMLAEIPFSEITDAEKENLVYGQQEERVARDVYLALAEQYEIPVFSNIAQAEDRHLEAIGSLLDLYDIPQTEGYGELQDLYNDLITKGSFSLENALEVGVMIEILDIEDLDKALTSTTNESIKTVYTNLRKGSVNHLNAFVRNMQQNGFDTDLDWEQFTTQENIENRGSGISQKGNSQEKGGMNVRAKGKGRGQNSMRGNQ